MPKDTRLSLRLPSQLKKDLEQIAAKEARSLAQVCEAILRDGVNSYVKEGSRYFSRLISRQIASK